MSNIDLERGKKQLLEIGINPFEFVKMFAIENAKFMEMSTESHKHFKVLLDQIKEKSGSAQERGKLLEGLVECLFFTGENPVFQILHNCRTSTNEIDILVDWNPIYKGLGLAQSYSFIERGFLCECKNYSNKVNVTYVGKFASLLQSMQYNFGFLISINGITGQHNWEDAKGFVRKLALAARIYIIDIDIHDLEQIYGDRSCFWVLVKKKYDMLSRDISYIEYLSEHEFQKEMEAYLQKCERDCC